LTMRLDLGIKGGRLAGSRLLFHGPARLQFVHPQVLKWSKKFFIISHNLHVFN
jgi:hypothetical protein